MEKASRFTIVICSLFFVSSALIGQDKLPPCTNCAAWNAPQAPLRVYGNTYYVGPHGLSSILITSDKGDILIDGALPESAPVIEANIRALGFRVEDIKLILNSHVHFDHAGGIAELQRMSGATVLASPWTADVMERGVVPRDDPQFGIIRPIARVAKARITTFKEGESFHLGGIEITPHSTPGHTPGGTSWTWQSCENGRCVNMVYADSVSAVSADGFKYSAHPDILAGFEKSFEFLSTTPCDILLTPHPDASNFWERVDGRQKSVTPDPVIDPAQCRKLAEYSREQLQKRIKAESGSAR